ncbi:MAG: hypothetical protein PUB56_00385 [Paraprevotella sp.]|nr:hypothetical protein [Paraprevotella sp.]
MKMNRLYIYIMFLAFCFSACTLTLDEYGEPKEETETEGGGDGITSPQTVINDFASCTYQFREGVRIIDESYLPYIISTETDTTVCETYIRLLKSIPGDMIPSEGEIMGTTIIQLFTYTLADMVKLVRDDGTHFTIVSSPVSLNMVFKELKVRVIADVVGDSLEGNGTRGEGSGETVRLVGAYKRNARTRSYEDLITGDKPIYSVSVSNTGNNEPDEVFTEIRKNKWHTAFKKADDEASSKIKFESQGAKFYYGEKCYSTIDCKFDLIEGLNIYVKNNVEKCLGVHGNNINAQLDIPTFSTGDVEVPKYDIFAKRQFRHLDFTTAFPNIISVGFGIKVLEVSASIGVGMVTSVALKAENSQNLHIEYKTEDSNLSNGIEVTKEGKEFLDPENPAFAFQSFRKELNSSDFSVGTRNFTHVEIGLSISLNLLPKKVEEGFGGALGKVESNVVGAAENLTVTASFTPLVVNFDYDHTNIDKSDYNEQSISKVKDGNYTYYATHGAKNYDRATLSSRITNKYIDLSGYVMDANYDPYSTDRNSISGWINWFNGLLSDKFNVHSHVLWEKESQGIFQTFKVDCEYLGELSQYSHYKATVHVNESDYKRDNQYADVGSVFRNLQLLVLDQGGELLHFATPTGEDADKEKNHYAKYEEDEDYTFEFYLDPKQIGYAQCFILAPAFSECYDWKGGWGNGYWSRQYRYFARPTYHSYDGHWAFASKIEPLDVVTGKASSAWMNSMAVAVDVDFSFPKIYPHSSALRIMAEFYDDQGNVVKTGKKKMEPQKRDGTAKYMFFCDYPKTTRMDHVKISLSYDDWDPDLNMLRTNMKLGYENKSLIKGDMEFWMEYSSATKDMWADYK